MASDLEDNDPAGVCAEILRRRGQATTCRIISRDPTLESRSVADAIASACGLEPLADRWREIDAPIAAAIATGILARDLAYEAEIIEATIAQALASNFLGRFAGGRYFTNGNLGEVHAGGAGPASWDPISTATFDSGVIAIAVKHAGILWVQDED